MYKYIFILTLFVSRFILPSESNGCLFADEIKIDIRTDKDIYLLGEDVYLIAKFTNTGNRNYSVGHFSSVIIKDSKGKSFRSKVIDFVIPKFTFNPGDTLNTVFALTSLFAPSKKEMYYFEHFPVGKYEVFLKLDKNMNGIDMESTHIFFNVINPGEKDNKTLNMLIQAEKFINEKKWDSAYLIYDEISKEKNNPYADEALKRYIIKTKFTDFKKTETFKNLCINFIYSYPDHPKTPSILFYSLLEGYYQFTNQKDEGINLIHKIIKEDLSENLTHAAKEFLNKNEKKPFKEWFQ